VFLVLSVVVLGYGWKRLDFDNTVDHYILDNTPWVVNMPSAAYY